MIFSFELNFIFFDIFIIFLITLLLIWGVVLNSFREFYYPNILLSFLFVVIVALIFSFNFLSNIWNINFTIFLGNYSQDCFSVVLKLNLIILFIICLISTILYFLVFRFFVYEYLVFILTILISSSFIFSVNDLFFLFLALELQSFANFILVSLNVSSRYSIEAALKYFILNSMSSCIFLLAILLLYILVGSTNYNDFIAIFFDYGFIFEYYYLFILFCTLIFISFLFKLSIFPLHVWSVDVYEGVISPVFLIFSIISKFIYLFVFLKLNFIFFNFIFSSFSVAILLFSFISLFFLNILGVYEVKLRRILIFSGFSHTSFLFLTIFVLGFDLINFITFYFLIYSLSLALIFIIYYNCLNIFFIKNEINLFNLSDLQSLSRTSRIHVYQFLNYIEDFVSFFYVNPYMLLIFVCSFFSLSALPPLLGFYSKFLIFFSFLNLQEFSFIFFIMVVMLISAFYYIRVIRLIFFNFSNLNYYFNFFNFKLKNNLLYYHFLYKSNMYFAIGVLFFLFGANLTFFDLFWFIEFYNLVVL